MPLNLQILIFYR